jgi:hypothetical protein
VAVPFEPRLAAIEPERAPIELTVAPVETLVDSVGPWTIVLVHPGVPSVHSRVGAIDSGFASLEPSFEAVVVGGGLRGPSETGQDSEQHDGEGGLPRQHDSSSETLAGD